MVNLAQRKGIPDEALPMLVSTAEAATLQLEFRYLSFLTGKDDYWEKVERVRWFALTRNYTRQPFATGYGSDQSSAHASRFSLYFYDVSSNVLALCLLRLIQFQAWTKASLSHPLSV
jgi:hypothetical protein